MKTFNEFINQQVGGQNAANFDAKITLNGNTLVIATQRGTAELQLQPQQAQQIYMKVGMQNNMQQPNPTELPKQQV